MRSVQSACPACLPAIRAPCSATHLALISHVYRQRARNGLHQLPPAVCCLYLQPRHIVLHQDGQEARVCSGRGTRGAGADGGRQQLHRPHSLAQPSRTPANNKIMCSRSLRRSYGRHVTCVVVHAEQLLISCPLLLLGLLRQRVLLWVVVEPQEAGVLALRGARKRQRASILLPCHPCLAAGSPSSASGSEPPTRFLGPHLEQVVQRGLLHA